MGLNVLVVGSGGREHALCWKISQSPLFGRGYAAPGNPGIAQVTGFENLPIKVMEIDLLVAICCEKAVDLVVIGPDDPLAAGLADRLRECGINVFGPSKAAAQIEGSKAFAKRIMSEAGIPTASYRIFSDYEEAMDYLRTCKFPLYIKASGLALGKGAYFCRTLAEAGATLYDVMVKRCHGDAGQTVVIEECLIGQETSVHALCDGKTFRMLPSSQDHKAVGDGDVGPNTGGMGVYCPTSLISASGMKRIGELIVKPIVRKLEFIGCLYPGLMVNGRGAKVLEYNCRFGDPETQALLPRLKTDLLLVLLECAIGELESELEWDTGYTCCVVMASGGYPGSYKKGYPINGIAEAEALGDVIVFQAGTAFQNGQLVTAGGRVLGVTARGDTLQSAITRVYEAVACIHFQNAYFRTDIGSKGLSA